MIEQIREHRVPIAVTVGALLIAVVFGVMPARENADRAGARAAKAVTDQVATLEERIAALEAAADTGDANISDPAYTPTREEIALIVKGLVNQTGRVSRLQDQVEALMGTDTDATSGTAPAPTREEIALIVKGLGNQTGRVSRLKKQVEGIIGGDIGIASDPGVEEEITLAKRGLANLTRRINGINDALLPLEDMPRIVDQHDLRLANVESAVTQIHRRVRALQNDNIASTDADLQDIESQLEQILTVLQAGRQ